MVQDIQSIVNKGFLYHNTYTATLGGTLTIFGYMFWSAMALAIMWPTDEMIQNIVWGLKNRRGFTLNVFHWKGLMAMCVFGFILGLFIVPTALYVVLLIIRLTAFLWEPLGRR